ncbi:MAG: hypothetical protein R3C49_15625 [Planctomycetaceae bacterium]
MVQVLQHLFQRLNECRTAPKQLITALNRHSVLNGCQVTISGADQEHQGTCIEVADDGALLLMSPTDGLRKII